MRRVWLRRLTITSGLIAGGCALFWIEPHAAFGPLEWAAPGVVWRVPTREPVVALSFDDGPSPSFTPQVLGILQRHGAHATFFLIGRRAAEHPDIVDAIKRGGHEIGNHYDTPGTALKASEAEFVDRLERAGSVLGLEGPGKLFRPPGGLLWPSQLRLARERGYTCVLGSAYPHDPSHPPTWYIRWLVTKNLEPGAIVILHDGIADPTRTIAALPEILEAGARKGLQFVSVGRLLASSRGSSDVTTQKMRRAASRTRPLARGSRTRAGGGHRLR